jgi:hypothetical protein
MALEKKTIYPYVKRRVDPLDKVTIQDEDIEQQEPTNYIRRKRVL